MIGFTRNEDRVQKSDTEQTTDGSLDFEKLRADMLTVESVERRDAYEDYNRGYRSF